MSSSARDFFLVLIEAKYSVEVNGTRDPAGLRPSPITKVVSFNLLADKHLDLRENRGGSWG